MTTSFAAVPLLALGALSIAFTVTEPAAAPSLPVDPTAAASAQRIRLVLAPDGNEARYRVREQLANIEFPNDAVGKTAAITGTLVLEADGRIVKEESKFVIDVTTLQSDAQMRDRYIQRNTLRTAEHPRVEFVPTAFTGLPSPLPVAGEVKLQITGDLTLRGVTKPVTWDVVLHPTPGVYSGSATTAFPFTDFGIDKPRVARVLSVADSIRLEYDFRLVPESAGT